MKIEISKIRDTVRLEEMAIGEPFLLSLNCPHFVYIRIDGLVTSFDNPSMFIVELSTGHGHWQSRKCTVYPRPNYAIIDEELRNG